MSSSHAVVSRMDEKLLALTEGFGGYVRFFLEKQKFTGPCLYFHRKALNFNQTSGSVEAIDSDEFFDHVYATLASWGMHRMGPGKTKLRELSEIRDSVRSQKENIKAIRLLKLTEIKTSEFENLSERVWTILDALRVSVAEAKIVANTKMLHHILPNLVPPMDRTYTFKFFYDRTVLSIDERPAFLEMYRRFHSLAVEKQAEIAGLLDSGWNSSITKVLDNAVMGFVLRR